MTPERYTPSRITLEYVYRLVSYSDNGVTDTRVSIQLIVYDKILSWGRLSPVEMNTENYMY